MNYYFISNQSYILAFDSDLNLVESQDKTIDKDPMEWSGEELKFIEKFNGKKYFIGIKKESIKNIEFIQDSEMIKKIISNNPKIKEQYLKFNMDKTIQDINTQLNDNSYKIIKSISIYDDLDNSLKRLTRRIYEEIDYYNPELIKNYNRENKNPSDFDYKYLINEILKNKDKKIGAVINENDINHIKNLREQYLKLIELKEKEFKYLDELMVKVTPNLQKIATTIIGAKLIKKAGNIKNLVFMSASLIQILGAEKALFRHLANKSAAPKYGLLFFHPLIIKATDKTKMAKVLANTITIAIRTDYFSPGKDISKELTEKINKNIK